MLSFLFFYLLCTFSQADRVSLDGDDWVFCVGNVNNSIKANSLGTVCSQLEAVSTTEVGTESSRTSPSASASTSTSSGFTSTSTSSVTTTSTTATTTATTTQRTSTPPASDSISASTAQTVTASNAIPLQDSTYTPSENPDSATAKSTTSIHTGQATKIQSIFLFPLLIFYLYSNVFGKTNIKMRLSK